jgi:protein TonB
MFSELVESVARPSSKRKGWAVATSAALQAACLPILIIIPLLYTEALPKIIYNSVLVAPAAPAPRPPAQAGSPRARPAGVRLLKGGGLIQPARIPRTVGLIDEPELPTEATAETGTTGFGSALDLFNVASDSPEPVSPPAPPAVPQRVPVTSTIQAARLVSRVQPIYPPLARQSRIEGSVVLHAVINKDGEVSELQVLSGHPLLVKAALDAVRQWRYSPTLLSGQAVEVETTITVTFVLAQ